MIKSFSLLALLFISSWTAAQENKLIIEDLGWSDRSFLERQVQFVDELARTELGTQLRNNYGDLAVLQTIVDRELIDSKDTEGLQALGAVIANLMLADVPSLEWKIYKDALGRSRALCAKLTKECLFPITMLSRRMEKGLKPNVKKVYEEGLAMLDAHVAQIPYGGGPERRLARQ
jgi:hypothetical protein